MNLKYFLTFPLSLALILSLGVIESSAVEAPRADFPKRIILSKIGDNTDKSRLYEELKLLEKKKIDESRGNELLKLSRAFLQYRLENYLDSLMTAKDVKRSLLDDLKYFILAESHRLLSQSNAGSARKSAQLSSLKESIKYYKKIITDFKNSPLIARARTNLIKSRILLCDRYFQNKSYQSAIREIKITILNHEGELSNKEQASKLYFELGESLYFERKYNDARKSYIQSKRYDQSQDKIDDRLKELAKLLPKPEEGPKLFDKGKKEPPLPVEGPKLTLTSSLFEPKKNEEDALNETITAKYKESKLSEALKGISEFFTLFPGSNHLKDLKELSQKIVKTFIDSSKPLHKWGEHYRIQIIDDTTLSYLNKLDLETMIAISSLLYRNEYLIDTGKILEEIVKEFPQSDFAPKAYLILARIYRVSGNFNKALDSLKIIYNKYSSSEYHSLSIFKSGLIYFQIRNYKEALKYFERYSTEASEDDMAQAYYWLTYTYESMNDKNKASEYKEKLRKEKPLSFYSVINDSFSHLLKATEDQNRDYSNYVDYIRGLLSISDDIHFRRALDFTAIGLLDFASLEIKLMSKGENIEKDVYLAWFLSQIGFYRQSISLIFRVPGLEPNFVNANFLKIFFPKEYLKELALEGELYNMDPLILLSLIKQESAFDEEALSKSGAIGLMQIMPFTADEVSAKLMIADSVPRKNINSPKLNISLCSFYFYDVLKNLNGNAVYSLAAYNAGPSRIKEWVNQNRDLSLLEFIEQIPVEETNEYVKNIVRNYIFYSYIIDKRLVSIADLVSIPFSKSLLIQGN